MLKRTAILLAVLALAVAGIGAFLARRSTASVPVLWEAPDFALTDHQGSPFSSAELNGTVWVASFIYTSCPDVCPLITARVAQLRDALAAEGVLGTRVRLVSFSVDPERDTPAVLRGYAENYGGAEPGRWAFLTGLPGVMREVVTKGFRLAAQTAPADHPPAQGEVAPAPSRHAGPAASGEDTSRRQPYLVLHSPRLVLVDGAGRVRGTYPATEAESMAKLTRALNLVLAEQ